MRIHSATRRDGNEAVRGGSKGYNQAKADINTSTVNIDTPICPMRRIISFEKFSELFLTQHLYTSTFSRQVRLIYLLPGSFQFSFPHRLLWSLQWVSNCGSWLTSRIYFGRTLGFWENDFMLSFYFSGTHCISFMLIRTLWLWSMIHEQAFTVVARCGLLSGIVLLWFD